MFKECIRIHGPVLAAILLVSACNDDSGPVVPSWEEFVTASTVEFEGRRIYIVDFDTPVSLDELRTEYDHLYGGASADGLGSSEQSSTVNRVNGQDDVWSAMGARNLRYCVSNEFGVNQNRAINEMAQATAAWEALAGVDYHYVPDQNGNCTGANQTVTFAVRPWDGGGACAFFPSGDACVARTLVMNFAAFTAGPITSLGVFRHELGHTLGLRHEHIRAPNPSCTEGVDWRGVTAYDSASVMHYPQCRGSTNIGDLNITALDATGIATLYPGIPPAPAECFFNWASANYPTLFAPARPATQVGSGYVFRYYSTTDAFLGVSLADQHVHYMGPNRVLQDLGHRSAWQAASNCP